MINFKYYELHFDTPLGKKTLVYELDDNPVTQLWIRAMTEADCKDIADDIQANFFFGAEKESIELKLDELVRDVAKDLPSILSQWDGTDQVTQATVNRLHYFFHDVFDDGKACNYSQTTQHHLEQINYYVHRWESCNRSSTVHWTMHRLNCTDPQIEIPDELRSYWNYRPIRQGDLLLGYFTVGKTLWHCARDNDMLVVKDRIVRPQMHINTQVMTMLPECDLPVTTNEDELHFRFKRWCKMNDTYSYGYDPDNLLHRGKSEPLVGRMLNIPPMQELCDIWKSKMTWSFS